MTGHTDTLHTGPCPHNPVWTRHKCYTISPRSWMRAILLPFSKENIDSIIVQPSIQVSNTGSNVAARSLSPSGQETDLMTKARLIRQCDRHQPMVRRLTRGYDYLSGHRIIHACSPILGLPNIHGCCYLWLNYRPNAIMTMGTGKSHCHLVTRFCQIHSNRDKYGVSKCYF